jgi:hypothetical protein
VHLVGVSIEHTHYQYVRNHEHKILCICIVNAGSISDYTADRLNIAICTTGDEGGSESGLHMHEVIFRHFGWPDLVIQRKPQSRFFPENVQV